MSPVVRASPSLSVLGSLDFAPKKISSKLSSAVAAEVADAAAAVADEAAAVADDAAFDACVEAVEALELAFDACVLAVEALDAAAVADEAAADALVVAAAASTIKSYLALLALVVSGCDPELVCASFTMKMLLVLVS